MIKTKDLNNKPISMPKLADDRVHVIAEVLCAGGKTGMTTPEDNADAAHLATEMLALMEYVRYTKG